MLCCCVLFIYSTVFIKHLLCQPFFKALVNKIDKMCSNKFQTLHSRYVEVGDHGSWRLEVGNSHINKELNKKMLGKELDVVTV